MRTNACLYERGGSRGGGGGGVVVRMSRATECKRRKINILNEKFDFLLLNILKLSHHNEGKEINFGHFCSSL